MRRSLIFTFIGAAALAASATFAQSTAVKEAGRPIRNIVLVHGMTVDGSTWRPVYDILAARGYHVTVVQEPLDGFANDVAATNRAIAAQDGPVVLVGHSYGGVVITAAGNDPKVKALVYVAALQPDRGETMGGLNARMPSGFPADGSVVTDGFVVTKPDVFLRYVAEDLPQATAAFLAASQTPTAASVFAASTVEPAWRHKPSFGIVAARDKTISPDLERWMYKRSKAQTIEVPTGHMAMLVEPRRIADVIVRAAQSTD